MIEPGRLCTKIAGRDAGKRCVIVEKLDDNFVIIDGETRRRKCNVKHLEPSEETLDIKHGASHDEVAKEFKKIGTELKETKPRQPKPKQKQVRAAERKKMNPKEDKKKPTKKESADTEKKTEEQPKKKESDPKETKLEKEISKE